ncbi:MAG: response regulator transcription factor [Clostridia bacterium]|jgi:two-component system response regulator ArlR|nr:response regulator transcription factor [Clostridiaceae bacterium]
MKKTILIIEDEQKIARFLQLELEHEGYAVKVAYDGLKGYEMACEPDIDLVILDLMLPGLSGIEVCRRLRKVSQVPVIMLTAKDDVSDKVMGLDMGADDYLTKPFAIEELLARIRVALKRSLPKTKPEENVLSVGLLTLNPGTRVVKYDGHPVELSKTEFDLLEYLLKNKNIVLTRDRLLEGVWGYQYGGNTNITDVYIKYLRDKIDNRFHVSIIETVRGVGYRIADEQ